MKSLNKLSNPRSLKRAPASSTRRSRSLRKIVSPRSYLTKSSKRTFSASLSPFSTIPGVSSHPEVIRRRAEFKQLETSAPDKIKPISIGTNGKDYPPFVFVLGGPGSGKGTHSERLILAAENKTHPGLQDKIYHINVGGVLRKAQFYYRDHKGSPTLSADMKKAGPVLEEMMATGQILPSWVTVTLLREELDQILLEIDTVKKTNPNYTANVIIDGFPRSIENLESFESLIAIPSRLLVMDVPTEIMVDRVIDRASGREDDNVATIKKRISVFESDTAAVLSQYCIEKSAEKALEFNTKHGAMRIGVKVWGDRPSEETSKDFIASYIALSNTPIY